MNDEKQNIANLTKLLSGHNSLIYYTLPNYVKRRCLALKKISLDQETLDIKYRNERRAICKKYESSFRELSEEMSTKSKVERRRSQGGRDNVDDDDDDDADETDSQQGLPFPFKTNPLETIAEKADDLKMIAQSSSGCCHLSELEESTSLSLDLFRSDSMKSILANCETKCNELLTHLANIDWELYEYEQSLVAYHHEMEDIMARYNSELSFLYRKRLQIIRGDYDPNENNDKSSLILPNFIHRIARPPKYYQDELLLERTFQKSQTQSLELLKTYLNHDDDDDDQIKGVPEFWLQSMSLALRKLNIIEEFDREVLKYLTDVQYYYDTERESTSTSNSSGSGGDNHYLSNNSHQLNSDYRAQLLLFFFDENPYFTNRILSKTVHIDKSRQKGVEMFDNLWVTQVEGCPINWAPELNDFVARNRRQSTKTVDDDDDSQDDDGFVVVASTSNNDPTGDDLHNRTSSFFEFFSESGFSKNRKVKRNFKGKEIEVQLDYDVFVRFRDFIAPNAIVAYSRGNLYGFASEQQRSSGLSQKLYYLNTLLSN